MNGTNGWDSLVSAVGGSGGPKGALNLKPGAGVAFWNFTAGGFVVDKTHKVLDIVEVGAAQSADGMPKRGKMPTRSRQPGGRRYQGWQCGR